VLHPDGRDVVEHRPDNRHEHLPPVVLLLRQPGQSPYVVQRHGLGGGERRRYAIRSVFGDWDHTSVGGDIERRIELLRAWAVSIDISAATGLVVGGTVSAVGVAHFEGVFHWGLHSSVFICMGATVTAIWR
jgi:hypothetical protein